MNTDIRGCAARGAKQTRTPARAALDFRIRFLEADAVATADVAVEGAHEELSEDLQGQGMTVHVFHQLLEIGLGAGSHADGAEQLHPGRPWRDAADRARARWSVRRRAGPGLNTSW